MNSPSSVRSSETAAAPAGWAFDAVIFDMDGVITDTASVHSRAWKHMFDEHLARRAQQHGTPFRAFSHERDYRTYVDGKPRYQGVAAFLAARGIALPWGHPADPAGAETVCGLGNRKNVLFNEIIGNDGVRVYDSSLRLIRALLGRGLQVGLATSSRNSALILGRTPAAAFFGTIVDGLVSERLGLKGKPAPDIFTTASANLGVPCARAVVVEDAVSGVQAGAAGGFGLVVGIAREGNAEELRENGADMVVHDLAEVSMEEINRRIRLKGAAA
ncbi:HAD family hydrolase [Lacunisphaera limnophila]|uniref:HAD family hydrolase n=1 Tax=Lacunisphaera limnophila TaxID=1838286 RepID=UPI001F0283BB|nr:HAD-IA family hydrolase [Lacunisphaera limnophila]